MLTLGQLVKAVHDLHVKVGSFNRNVKIADQEDVQKAALALLQEVEDELERIGD